MGDTKSTNIKWHAQAVERADLEKLHGHKGATIWFTGFSGSGKSTLANAVAVRLHQMGVSTYVLDGDNVRHGLNRNLTFAPQDRKENIRRIAEVARLFSDAAIINLTAFISPYRADRQLAREIQPDRFVEVHCAADLSVCEARDPKGLYKKARAGEISGFTGIEAPYEPPEAPEVVVDTGKLPVEEGAMMVINYLKLSGLIS